VVVTVGLAVLFGRQQVRTLRGLPGVADLPAEDRVYLRNQAWRRLAGCALLVGVAVMLSVWFLTGQHDRIDRIGDEIQARRAAGEVHLTSDQERAKQFFAYYWIAVLLQLLAVIVLAALDVSAIRRYAARHSRLIREGRREMLQRELAALRRERGRPGNNPSVN
jgi:hypothetical protein